MNTNRAEAFRRAVRGHCPRCNHKPIFASPYRLHNNCPKCALPLEQEDGWSLGAIPLNYSLTCVGWIAPIAILFLIGWIPMLPAAIAAAAGAVTIPFLTYRYSKCVWVGLYYAILPQEMRTRTEGEKGDVH